jgi:hypothetical protein
MFDSTGTATTNTSEWVSSEYLITINKAITKPGLQYRPSVKAGTTGTTPSVTFKLSSDL